MGVKTNGISFSYVEIVADITKYEKHKPNFKTVEICNQTRIVSWSFFLFNDLSCEVVVRLLILVELVTISV
jgi:hypothetical protein